MTPTCACATSALDEFLKTTGMASTLTESEMLAMARRIVASAQTQPVPEPPKPVPVQPPKPVPSQFRLYSADDIAKGNTRGKKVPPVVTKQGLRAFEARFPKGQRGGGSSNSNFEIVPVGVFPRDEVRMSFKLFFDQSFPWTPTKSMPTIGGKLGGFTLGTEGKASGGEFSTTAASYRITFANEGGLLAYVYPQLSKEYTDDDSSNISWKLLDQAPEFQKVSRISKGIHVFMPEGGKQGKFDLVLKKGTWNDISMYVKLNSLGKHDGILELTVNGVTKRTEHARLRSTNILIESFKMSLFFGSSQHPPHDTKAWYADFQFSRS